MTDYIKREDAVRLIRNYGKGAISDGLKTLDPVDDIVYIAGGVEMIEAADVEPIRRAKWVPSRYNGYRMCSACEGCLIDEGWPLNTEHKWKYCPECGARMEDDDG